MARSNHKCNSFDQPFQPNECGFPKQLYEEQRDSDWERPQKDCIKEANHLHIVKRHRTALLHER